MAEEHIFVPNARDKKFMKILKIIFETIYFITVPVFMVWLSSKWKGIVLPLNISGDYYPNGLFYGFPFNILDCPPVGHFDFCNINLIGILLNLVFWFLMIYIVYIFVKKIVLN